MYLAVGKNYWQLHSTSWCLSGSSGMFYGRLKPSQRRQEASRWQTDATGREENRRKADPSPAFLALVASSHSLCFCPRRWGRSPPSFGGRRLVTQTKENTLLEGTNIGSFFLKPSRILPWESWTKAALSTERTAREPFSMMTDKHEET